MSDRTVIVFWDYFDLEVVGGNWRALVKKAAGIARVRRVRGLEWGGCEGAPTELLAHYACRCSIFRDEL